MRELKIPYLLPIILILGFICCGCSKTIKGEQGKKYLSAKLLNKYHFDDHSLGTINTIYEIEFTNLSDKDLSQYEGVLKIFDIIGKEIASIDVKDTKGIKVKSNTTYTYESSIESVDDAIKIQGQGIEDLEIKWTPEKIVLDKY